MGTYIDGTQPTWTYLIPASGIYWKVNELGDYVCYQSLTTETGAHAICSTPEVDEAAFMSVLEEL